MQQFIETIKIRNGQISNLEHHQARLDRAMKAYYPQTPTIDLQKTIHLPASCRQGLIKCRIVYSSLIHAIEFTPYMVRPVHSLRLVSAEDMEYDHKYSDRTPLTRLFEQRQGCDDIIMVKKGRLTDSYYANLVFDDGKILYTPLQPLLPGTKRAKYLEEHKLKVADLKPVDIGGFQSVHLINAMMDIGDCVVAVENVVI